MLNILSLLSFTVYAAETIISPIADSLPVQIDISNTKPTTSFGLLTQSQNPVDVLGEATEVLPDIEPSPAQYAKTSKSEYKIALLGDSMVDTLGPEFSQLSDELKKAYPQAAFKILNYGVGATNIDYGLERITNSYTYLDQPMPSLNSQNTDIVVVESFGYNPYPYDEGALDKHWLTLSQIIDRLRSANPEVKIIIAATIAPNSIVFGDGAPGVNIDPVGKIQHSQVIKKYLESTIKFAQSQNLPLADAYHPSLDGDGNGKLEYINAGDHIHYSDSGRELMAEVISKAIINNKLLE